MHSVGNDPSSLVWIVLVIVCVIGLVYYLNENMQNDLHRTEQHTDLEMFSVLREDIPRVTFIELERRFPFDLGDPQYLKIEKLKRHYYAIIHRLVYYWNESVQLQKVFPPELFDFVENLDICLNDLHDILIQYCNVESEAVRTFDTYHEEVCNWLQDLKVRNQGKLRNLV